MNDPTATTASADKSGTTPDTATSAVAPHASHANRIGDLLARVTLTHLTLVVLVVIFVWQWLDAHSQLNQTQQEVARRLSEVEAANKANQMLVAQNQELVRELGGKLSLVESKYAETQNQRAALESLYQEMSSSRDQTALAEVEQMLLIAGQQLQLSGNVKAALIAMQQAESRLQRPAFATLKKRIGQDIDKLRALPNVDVPAINLRLDGVIGAVDKSAAGAGYAYPAAEAGRGGRSGRGRMEAILARSVARDEAPGAHREYRTPGNAAVVADTDFLPAREPEAAPAFRAHGLADARRGEFPPRPEDFAGMAQALFRYQIAARSAQALGALQKLAASKIVIDMPDISGSLEAVRNYRVSHERGAR